MTDRKLLRRVSENGATYKCVVTQETFITRTPTFKRDSRVPSIIYPQPPSSYTLTDAQLNAYSWLVGKGRGLLEGDVGVGKTVIGAAVIARLNPKRAVIVVPRGCIPAWLETLAGFGLSAKEMISVDQLDLLGLWVAPMHWFSDHVLDLGVKPFDLVMLDEAHHFTNGETILVRALQKLEAPCRFALTATPWRNYISDFYHLLQWMGKSEFPFTGKDQFIATCSQSKGRQEVYQVGDISLVSPMLVKFVYTLDMKTCRPDHPGLDINVKRFTAPQEPGPYGLLHFCDTFSISGEKADFVEHAIDEYDNLIINGQHLRALRHWANYLAGRGISHDAILGETPDKARVAAEFKAGKTKVLLMSWLCAEGYSLENCSNMIILSPGYGFAPFWQSVGRIFRLNSPKKANVDVLVTKGTAEETALEILGIKGNESRTTMFDEPFVLK